MRTALAEDLLDTPASAGATEKDDAPPVPQVAEQGVRVAFERFELKYWVPEAVAREAVRFAHPHVIPDPYSDARHLQHNTSLYLDTPDHDFMKLHVEAAPSRFKLRVRRYGDPPCGPAFFEVKHKVKGTIVKRRAMVPAEAMGPLLDGDCFALRPLKRDADRRNLEAFLYLMTVHRARPTVWVSCVREAYVSPDRDEDVRLTVDRDIVYQAARSPGEMPDPAAWMMIDGPEQRGERGGRTLIELKFRGVAPWWMAELVQRLAMNQRGYSKYVSALARELGESWAFSDEWTSVPAWEG